MPFQKETKVRIDKWLWAVRICKTRTIAADLCLRHKIRIDGQLVKPSREVKEGQVVIVQQSGIKWIYKIIKCIDKRVGANIASECKQSLTPQEEIDKLTMIKRKWAEQRPQGKGRPTKKERRDLEKFLKDENGTDYEKIE